MRLIIANSYVFNSQDTPYYALTKEFQAFYDELWNEYKKGSEKFINSLNDKTRKEAEEYQ